MNTILFSICLLGCFTYLLTKTFHNKYNILTTFIFFIVSSALLSIVNSNGIQIAITLFILFTYAILLYEGKISNILECFFLYSLFVLLAYISGNKMIEMLFSNNINIYTIEFTYLTIILTLLLLYMIFSYTKLVKLFEEVNLPNNSKYILFLPIGCMLIISFMTYIKMSPILVLLLICLLLILSLLVEFIYISSIHSLNKEHEKTLQRYMEASSQNKYDLLNQQYQNSFNLLHEIMHKCNELVIHMKNKNYPKVEDELKNITNATFKEFNEIYSNSVVFNTLLSNRKDLLQKYNIHVNSTIEFNNFDFISFSNQVDLFNTLLDFVLEEAKVSNTNKHVFIKSNIVANQVVLSFRFANNHNKNLQREIYAALEKILSNYEAILSVNEIDENTASLLILFPKQN